MGITPKERKEHHGYESKKVSSKFKLAEEVWPVIIQPALVGKARSAFLSLIASECKDYDFIKDNILKIYELTPEYYRLRFKRFRKCDKQSYVEYTHGIVKLHDKWIKAAGVTCMKEYRELMLLEQFLRGIPVDVQRYLFERVVTTLQRANTLAENFGLLKPFKRGSNSRRSPHTSPCKSLQNSPHNSPGRSKNKGQGKDYAGNNNSTVVKCYFCGEVGHIRRNCPRKLKNKEKTGSVACSLPRMCRYGKEKFPVVREEFKPICFIGKLCVPDESSIGISVRIVRDTGSSHSLVVRDAVPGIENCMTQDSVILKSIGGLTTVPRAKLHVDLKDLEEKAMFLSRVVEHSLMTLDTAKNLICTDAVHVDVAAGDVVEKLADKLSSDRRQGR
ncbi:uncharacterized protein [Palaemon carinicauda]|uniref:uncharacterized protein n=1 Tax=Palaemon carinicauda TaxID=392227 RepID=UPI0035B667D7